MVYNMKTKIRPYLSFRRVTALAGLVFLLFLSSVHFTLAQALTEGYGSDEALHKGMIIQLKKQDAKKVEAVSASTAEQMHGVIVDANDAPVTLSSDGQKVFVATSGHNDVLVSNQNGSIQSGDYIAVSAIKGIGMKAGSKESVIIGRALAAFDGKDALSTTVVKDSNGASQNVSIGYIATDVKVSHNPLLKSATPNVPDVLRKASEAIAGKPVNAVRIYAAILVFLITTIVALILMYGGIRSALTSIGRNPLSKKSIIRGMMQVVITGLTIFISGIFGVYLLLKL